MADKKEVIIWPSNRIQEAYLEDNYLKPECGTLGGSCMRYKSMQKALNFYVKNGVKIAVVISNNKILGRALIWEDVLMLATNKKVNYIDRIYYADEATYTLFKHFIKESGYQSHQYGAKDILYKPDINIKGTTHLPYTDTFRYLFITDKILSTDMSSTHRKLNLHENILTLTHTRNYGYYRELDKNAIKEVLRDEWISKKDAVFIKKYNGHVLKSHILDVDGEYFSYFDTKHIIRLGDENYCHRKYVVKELFTGHNIDKTKSVKTKDGYIGSKNIININDKLYSKYDPDIVKCVDTYYHKSDCFHKDGIYIPKLKAIIIYTLTKDGQLNEESYINSDEKDKYIELYNGVLIDHKYSPLLVKYNNKYYLRSQFKKNNPNQLLMFGLTPSKAPLDCL